MVFQVGNNIDKKKVEEYSQKISRDKDIRRLIRFGKRNIRVRILFLILLIIAAVKSLVDTLPELTKIKLELSTFVTLEAGRKIIFFAIWLFLLVIFIKGIIDNFIDILESVRELPGYVNFTLNKINNPLQLWNTFNGSVSDIQMVTMCHSMISHRHNEKAEVDNPVFYTGIPYYQNTFIDSISIQWTKTGRYRLNRFEIIRLQHNYNRFFWRFANKVIISAYKKERINSSNTHINYSNSVFGMLYTSAWLKYEYDRRRCQTKDKVHIFIDSPDDYFYKDLQNGGNENKKNKYVTKQWVEYCTAPEFFDFVEKAEEADLIARLVIKNECGEKNVTRKKINIFRRIWHRKVVCSDTVIVPVKRMITYPNGAVDGESDGYNTYKIIRENSPVICIGGAEQNMALQFFVNMHRWTKKTENGRKIYPYIGFGENSFEDETIREFQAGTEGLVYGVKESMKGRLGNSVPKEAELFYFDVDGIEFYSIYGMSAMLTKMSLATFMYRFIRILSDNEKDKCDYTDDGQDNNYIPGKARYLNHILEYMLNQDIKDGNNVMKEAIDMWDESDCMNHNIKMNEWLQNKEYIHINHSK